jgi:hypothetical protein
MCKLTTQTSSGVSIIQSFQEFILCWGKAYKKILRADNVNHLVLVNGILQIPENCDYTIKDVLEMVIPVKIST